MATAARQLSYERTTALVARALGISAVSLEEAFLAAGPEHLAQVVELRKRALNTPVSWDDRRYLAWRYHFGSTTTGGGDCFIVVRGAQVVGMVGTERIEFLCDAETIPAQSTMDIAVHPDHEGTGLGAWMAMRAR